MPDQIKKRKLLGKVSVLVGAILLVAVLFSAIAVAPVAPRVAHAECTEGALYDDVTNAPCVAPTPPENVGSVTTKPDEPSESKWNLLSWLNPAKWLPLIVQFLGNIILGLMALIAALGGLLLDGAMWMTMNMSGIMKQVTVVDVGWTAFRDVANMLFIFVLIYIAIKTILNVGETKKMLVDVIVTALLINFSLFFCKVAVDASNMLALSFYNRMQSEYVPPVAGAPGWMTGPSSTLFASMKLGTTYNFAKNADAKGGSEDLAKALAEVSGANALLETQQIVGKVVLGSIMLLVFAFTLAVAAFLLIIRIVTLMFLMMISPLAVVARILPRTQSSWNKWFEAFVNNAIYAPAYFALLYVVVRTAKSGLGFEGTIDGLASNTQAAMGVALNYIFMIILIGGTIFVAKSLSIHGASTASAMGKSASNWARSKAKAAGGWGMRNTIGRGAQAAQERLQQTTLGRSRFGSALFGGTVGAAAKAKFGGQHSYKEAEEARKKDLQTRKGGLDQAGSDPTKLYETAHAEGYGDADRKKMYDAMSDRQKVLYEEEARKRGTTSTLSQIADSKKEKMNRDQREKLEEAYLRELREDPAKIAGRLTQLPQDLRDHMYDKMSARDRVAVETELKKPPPVGTTRTLPNNPATGAPMTSDEFTVSLRDKLSPEEKEKTEKSARESARDEAQNIVRKDIEDLARAIQTAISTTGANPLATAGGTVTFTDSKGASQTVTADQAKTRFVSTASDATLQSMDTNTLTAVAPAMKGGQYRNVQKSATVSPQDKQRISESRHQELNTAVTTKNVAGVAIIMGNMEPDDVAALDDTHLMNPLVIANLDAADLEKLADKGVKKAVRTKIKNELMTKHGTGAPVYDYITTGLGKDYWQ